jgi:hypothetical protein
MEMPTQETAMSMESAADELFQGLSTDPHLASYELLQRLNRKILPVSPREADYSHACGVLEAFYAANGWKSPDAVKISSYSSKIDEAVEYARNQWRLQFEGYQKQIMANYKLVVKQAAVGAISAATAKTFGYAVPDANEKAAILKHIEKIRSLIEQSQLEDRKKNSLFEYLSALTLEVNRNGTRTDRFFAFASEVGFCLGQFVQETKPVFDEVKDVLRIITRARARQDGVKLPPGEEVLSLPQPPVV